MRFQTINCRFLTIARNKQPQFFLGLSCGLLVLCIVSGLGHDYLAYVRFWNEFWNQGIMWRRESNFHYPSENAYGPFFQLLSPLAFLHPLLPKLLFFSLWMTLIWQPYFKNARFGIESKLLIGLPYFWISIANYGHNDFLPALLVVVAIYAQGLNRPLGAAAALAAAFLFKFIPLAFAPFIAFHRRKLSWPFAVGFLIMCGFGILLTWLLYGETSTFPLEIAVKRTSKLFSIFSPLDRLAHSLHVKNPSDFSFAFLAIGGFAVFCFHMVKGLKRLEGCLLASLVLVIGNKVGHLQFFVYSHLLLIYSIAQSSNGSMSVRSKLPLPAITAFFGLFSLLYLLYPWTGGYNTFPWQFIRSFGAIPVFGVSLWLLIALLFYYGGSHQQQDPSRNV